MRAQDDPDAAGRVTVWVAPTVPVGDTRNTVDAAAGLDVDLSRRGAAQVSLSLGYVHALTRDAGNVHRFPLLVLARTRTASGAKTYVGAGAGAVFSDESSARIGVVRRTESAFALLAGTEFGARGRAELRFTAGERPARDGTFLFCLGARL